MNSNDFIGIDGWMVTEMDLHGLELLTYAALANPRYPDRENQRDFSWLVDVIYSIHYCAPLRSQKAKEDTLLTILELLEKKNFIRYRIENGIIKYTI